MLPNWSSEFKQFAPKIRVVQYHGSREVRERIQEDVRAQVMKQPKEQRKDPTFDFDGACCGRCCCVSPLATAPPHPAVVLTTYEAALQDTAFLGRFRWRLGVVDEAHRVKNYHSKTFTVLTEQYAVQRFLLLTGTPIQNKLTELYAMLALAVPRVFPLGMADAFVKAFAPCVSGKADTSAGAAALTMSDLQALLTPVMLRRTLAEVGLSACVVFCCV